MHPSHKLLQLPQIHPNWGNWGKFLEPKPRVIALRKEGEDAPFHHLPHLPHLPQRYLNLVYRRNGIKFTSIPQYSIEY